MTFDEILPRLMQGEKAARELWAAHPNYGSYVQRIQPALPDGRPVHPVIMVWSDRSEDFCIWGGINRDIQEDDWVILDQ